MWGSRFDVLNTGNVRTCVWGYGNDKGNKYI